MAKRLITTLGISVTPKLTPKSSLIRQIRKLHNDEVPVKEITIPVQWGHLAAKLWGSETERPILALHGWQDNAGSWDPLAPHLVRTSNRPILALDFPGHGLSSWYPPGMHYYSWDFARLIMLIKEHFKWEKVAILAHSMGSIASFRYASLFSDSVEFYIGVDSLIFDDYDLNFVVDKYPVLLKKGLTDQSRLDTEPPSYTREEIIKIWHLGTRKSVAMENVPYLMDRGVKPSKADPNKFYYSRDARIKHTLFNPEAKKFVEALALRLKCPTLYIKAIDSPYASDAFAVEMRELMEKNSENFETQFLPGTHHLHLNTPELVLPVIMNFLAKYNLV